MSDLSRAQFLARGVKGGAALVAGGALLGLAGPALAGAEPAPAAPSEEDLAIVRLAASAELLAEAFYNGCLNAKQFAKEARTYLVEARRNEHEHYAALAQVLGAGAPLADDYQFTFPAGAFKSSASAAKLGVSLETTFVGTYLGAVAALQDAALRDTAAQIAASEAMHLSFFSDIVRGTPIGPAFPPGFDVEQATAALDPYFGE